MDIKIYYDGECPFCRNYVRLAKIRSQVHSLELIDLRNVPELYGEFSERGMCPDEGMIIDADGELYHGRHAVSFLASFKVESRLLGMFNQLFSSMAFLSSATYFFMRLGRSATLFFLGKTRLSEDNSQSSVLTIFSCLLGIFCVLHFFVYAYHYGLPLYFSSYLIPVFGGLLFLFPEMRRLFAIVVFLLFIDGILHAPVFSNHTNLKNFLVFSILVAAALTWVKGRGEGYFFGVFSPVARCLLLIMYFFGVFHKLNSGFFSPSSSCAIDLWAEMPFYINRISGSFFSYVLIYGAILLEIVIMVGLVCPRTRALSVVAGVSFHSMLALSGYALYAPFSMLTIALHSLFISSSHANKIVSSQRWQSLYSLVRRPIGIIFFILVISTLGVLSYLGQYSSVGLVWVMAMTPIFMSVFFYNLKFESVKKTQKLLAQPYWINMIAVIFFINCFAPYLGLKTGQTMNMFANLRLEAGVTNHFIMGVPRPFGYLGDVVKISEARSAIGLRYFIDEDLGFVYYSLLDYLERNPKARVSFNRKGESYSLVGFNDLPLSHQNLLHPRWVRAWLSFTPVDFTSPKPCALDR